jgi:hypothetical protein
LNIVYDGKYTYSFTHTQPGCYKEVDGQHHAPAALSPGKNPVSIAQEATWASGQVWTGAENVSATGIQSRERLLLTVCRFCRMVLLCHELYQDIQRSGSLTKSCYVMKEDETLSETSWLRQTWIMDNVHNISLRNVIRNWRKTYKKI